MDHASDVVEKFRALAQKLERPIAEGAIVLSIQHSRDDVARAHAIGAAQLFRSPANQRVRRRQAGWMSVLASILLVCGVALIPSGSRTAFMALFIGALILHLAWSFWRRPGHAVVVNRVLARLSELVLPRYSYEHVTFVFDREGYRGVSSHSMALVEWAMILSVEVDAQMVLVKHSNGGTQILPLRAFASADAMRATGAQLAAWLDASGHGEANTLRAYLREHPTPCPFCKKSLSGEDLRCSGCDESVTQQLVPEAFCSRVAVPTSVPCNISG